MYEFDTMTKLSHARQILTVFDSCFSGTIFSVMLSPIISLTAMDLARVRDVLRRPVRYYITAGRAKEKVPADFPLATLLLRGLAGDANYAGDGFVTAEELGLYLQRNVPNMVGRLITPQYEAVNDATLSAGKFVFLSRVGKISIPLGREVQSFTWIYGFQTDPGLRSWSRDEGGIWHERYPSGRDTATFSVVGREVVNRCNGSVVRNNKESGFEAFIPDLGCDLMWARFRWNNGEWKWMGQMNDIH
jgi:hypothetical protein